MVLLLACAPDNAPDGPTVHMDFGPGGAFFDAPFPSVGREANGFPNPDGLDVVDTLGVIASARDGHGSTSGVMVRTDLPIDDVDATIGSDDVRLVVLSGDRAGERIPIDVRWLDDAGPYGDRQLLVALPLQGYPMAPSALHALVVSTRTGLSPSPTLARLRAGGQVPGLDATSADAYRLALAANPDAAGLAVVRTGDPTAVLRRAVSHARALSTPPYDLVLTDVYDDYCVFEGRVDLPVFQGGEPPFLTSGGGWVYDEAGDVVLQRIETGRFWLTLPRRPTPDDGWPVAMFIRTGGGADRALVDRGPHDATLTSIPGTGPSALMAAAGVAGVSFDGVHGGLRNVAGTDEQFLMFNVTNLEAVRDNVRQSALEVALLPDWLPSIAADTSACSGADEPAFDSSKIALLGHSMGATIAPLTLAVEPRFGAGVLSGAGGSWIENLVHKQKPLEVEPLAASMLGVDGLHEHEPALQLLQWAAEDADPPPYLWGVRGAHMLVVQGIVDHYILPPIAAATNLSAALDLGGDALDEVTPELETHRPMRSLLPLVGRDAIGLPATGNRDGVTAIVVQHREDGLEDGHEAFFQVDAARRQLRCFLASWVTEGTPTVVSAGDFDNPC